MQGFGGRRDRSRRSDPPGDSPQGITGVAQPRRISAGRHRHFMFLEEDKSSPSAKLRPPGIGHGQRPEHGNHCPFKQVSGKTAHGHAETEAAQQ